MEITIAITMPIITTIEGTGTNETESGFLSDSNSPYSRQDLLVIEKKALNFANPSCEAGQERGRVEKQKLHPRGAGETVLLVDDEVSILTVIKETLDFFGYRILTARDGVEAVVIYVRHQKEIAVVVTDIMMPQMGGLATIRALTKINPKVKIVAASGLQTNRSLVKAFGVSVRYFLEKPYTAENLLTVLRATIDETDLH